MVLACGTGERSASPHSVISLRAGEERIEGPSRATSAPRSPSWRSSAESSWQRWRPHGPTGRRDRATEALERGAGSSMPAAGAIGARGLVDVRRRSSGDRRSGRIDAEHREAGGGGRDVGVGGVGGESVEELADLPCPRPQVGAEIGVFSSSASSDGDEAPRPCGPTRSVPGSRRRAGCAPTGWRLVGATR